MKKYENIWLSKILLLYINKTYKYVVTSSIMKCSCHDVLVLIENMHQIKENDPECCDKGHDVIFLIADMHRKTENDPRCSGKVW